MSASNFSRFAQPGQVDLDTLGEHPRLRLTSPMSTLEITPFGAHVTGWQPAGQRPVLFMSGSSWLAAGKPIRGGVPLVFPWFGTGRDGKGAPPHGFGRIRTWEVLSAGPSAGGGSTIELRSTDDEQTRAAWPHAFEARLLVQACKKLRIRFSVTNTGNAPFSFESALHTYFAVSDAREVGISGLESAPYLDRVSTPTPMPAAGAPIRITAETDRAYLDTGAACTIDDPAWGRRIVIEKSGSSTTVVWNPWVAKSRAMPDFGDEEWPGMLCVETANALSDAVTLEPGATHVLEALISVEAR